MSDPSTAFFAPALTGSDIERSLALWFANGHSRFTLILQGARRGRVLLANASAEPPYEIIERHVISDRNGLILERSETPLSAKALACDPVNGPALVAAVRARLLGETAPPPICDSVWSHGLFSSAEAPKRAPRSRAP